MRAILIDAFNKEVREEEFDIDSLKFMQTAVGGLIEIATSLLNGDDVFVNEEGLLMDLKEGFGVLGTPSIDRFYPFRGNGVILSHDPKSGDSLSAVSSLEDIQKLILFVSFDEEGTPIPVQGKR